jgi:hypothetical protein
MITRRFFISGIVTTAAVASASQYIPAVAAEPQPYATVVGIGWDNEVIEHVIYEPMSVGHFGGTPAIDKFKQVTECVYAFDVEPLPKTYYNPRGAYAIDPLSRFRIPEYIKGTPFLPEGYTPPFYMLAEDMGPSAQVGIWDPNRAVLDDEAVGGNNRKDHGTPLVIDEHFQQHFDEMHLWEKKWQAKYPHTGLPPNDSPDWDAFWESRAKMDEPTGRKLMFKVVYE